MLDKRMTPAGIVAELKDGMTIGIGGWGPRRKPMALIREIAIDRGLTVVCSLHQVDLALSWGDRIVGLRHGNVVLDTPTEGLSKAQAMEIYGRVATTTSELHAIETELLVDAVSETPR